MRDAVLIGVLLLIAGGGMFGQTKSEEISKCVGDKFSEVLCESPNFQVQLVNAFFGELYWRLCRPDTISQNPCRVNVRNENPDYYTEIQEACQGDSCGGLVAKSQWWTTCNTRIYRETDYVTILYKCIRTDLPTEISTSKQSATTLETTTNITLIESTITTKTSPGLGVNVGVPIAVVIIVAIVLVLVLYMFRMKRASKGNAPQHGNDGVITNENVYTNTTSRTTEFTESQDDAIYENQQNADPLVYSLATGSVRLTNSTRDETDTDMIVYDNDNYTPYPRSVNTQDFNQIDGQRDNEGNDTILCDNTNYSSFADGENTQDVTIIEDNLNYAGYNSEPSQNNDDFHQNFNDEEDQTVLFDNQQYASTEEAVPTDKEEDTDIMAENLNYEAWDQ